MINRCIGCHYYDSKENVCTHGSPIFIDDICTDYQDSEFVKQIRAEVIEKIYKFIKAEGNPYGKPMIEFLECKKILRYLEQLKGAGE